MSTWLTKFQLWWTLWGHLPPIAIMTHTRELCDSYTDLAVSGEYKRHQVYARLLKKFPDANKRTLGLAIELTLLTC